jgi:predicted phage-related endonuclease
MPITAEQRLARRHHIGSSDSAAILGVHPKDTAADIYAQKVYDVAEITDKQAIRLGNLLEPALIAWAQEELGIELQANVNRVHPNGILVSNLDARAVDPLCRIGVEAKTTGIIGSYGEPGTDQCPDHVLVQALHHCEVHELDLVYVPVLLARPFGWSFEMFQVKADSAGQAAIVDRDVAFWNNNVLPKIPPPASLPALDLLKRIRREPAKQVEIDPVLVEQWREAVAERKDAERFEQGKKEALLAAMGDAEAATFGEFGKWITFYSQTRKEHLVPESTFRVLREAKRP